MSSKSPRLRIVDGGANDAPVPRAVAPRSRFLPTEATDALETTPLPWRRIVLLMTVCTLVSGAALWNVGNAVRHHRGPLFAWHPSTKIYYASPTGTSVIPAAFHAPTAPKTKQPMRVASNISSEPAVIFVPINVPVAVETPSTPAVRPVVSAVQGRKPERVASKPPVMMARSAAPARKEESRSITVTATGETPIQLASFLKTVDTGRVVREALASADVKQALQEAAQELKGKDSDFRALSSLFQSLPPEARQAILNNAGQEVLEYYRAAPGAAAAPHNPDAQPSVPSTPSSTATTPISPAAVKPIAMPPAQSRVTYRIHLVNTGGQVRCEVEKFLSPVPAP